jgi:hypothetical protein
METSARKMNDRKMAEQADVSAERFFCPTFFCH